MSRYEVSEAFRYAGWQKYDPAENGMVEKHKYYAMKDDAFLQDGSKIVIRIECTIDANSGKPNMVIFSVGTDQIKVVNSEILEINTRDFTGKFCELQALTFVRDKLFAYNTLLHQNFKMNDLEDSIKKYW